MCRSGSSCLSAAIQTSRITAPHVGQIGRSTTRSGKEIVLKGATGDLVCRSHADQGCRQQRWRQRPGVRLQRRAQGKTRKALIVPRGKDCVLPQLLSGQYGGFFGLVPASSAVRTAAPEKQNYDDND